MRVMFAVPCYYPSQDGVTKITEYLAEGLATRGHTVLCYAGIGARGEQELSDSDFHNGVNIERIRVDVRWPLRLKGLNDKSSPKAYVNKVMEFKPDALVVVCTQTWTFDWIMPYLDKIKCSKIFYSHGYSAIDYGKDFWVHLKNRNIVNVIASIKCDAYYKKLHRYLKQYDKAIYLSDNNNSYEYAMKYHLSNGVILENAIEDEFFNEDMNHGEEVVSKNNLTFLYVANYGKGKNQKKAIEAFLLADIGDSKLQLVGFEENAYYYELENMIHNASEEKKDKIILNTHLTRQEVYALYKESDCFVCTSNLESWGIVHREAAVTGMPVISTDVGNVSKMEGIVLAETVDDFKEKMELFYNDRKLMHEHGVRIRESQLKAGLRVIDKVDKFEQILIEEKG